MRDILYVEGCNFRDFPLGGTLSFARQLINNVDEQFFLVGLADADDPIGSWFWKEIDGRKFQYFAIGKTADVAKSKIPKRIVVYRMLKRHLQEIYRTKKDVELVFSQTPQYVFLISKFKWNKFCFCFAGLGNSVGRSRYRLLRAFGSIYERKLFEALKKNCDVILAAADQESIDEKIRQYEMKPGQIMGFPTRFDKDVFHTIDQQTCRNMLKISESCVLLVTTGRLSYIKGWSNLVNSFRIFNQKFPNSKLIFIGDGEDREEIMEYAQKEIQNGTIELAGRKKPVEIAVYLNAADVFLMFSLLEGWPTAMVEAIACGKNVVTSKVSGAKDMIIDGQNGYVLMDRDSAAFAEAIEMTLKLPNPNPISLGISSKFSSLSLSSDFYNLTNR